jgi:cellulose synthase/poly-beta-1,6-N-acetylglucosamine synthase-like glycosyltransferase
VSVAGWLFLIPIALLVYHWVAFPAILHIVVRLACRRTTAANLGMPSVSVLVPAYNEEAAIGAKVRNCLELEYPSAALEILVVSDASTDNTDAIAAAECRGRVRLVRLARRVGYSGVLSRLAQLARGELLFFTDADVLLEHKALLELIGALADPSIGVACARYRRSRGDGHAGEGLYDQFESWLKQNESQLGALAGAYGAAMLVRRKAWRPVPDDTILGDLWIANTAQLMGFGVVQVDTALATGQIDSVAGEFRRRARIGRGALQAFLRRPASYAPWAGVREWVMFSHKGLRLFAPWLLLTALVGNIVGVWSSKIWLVPLVVQCAILASIPLLLVRRAARFHRLLFVQYFVLMNAALAVGAVVHIVKHGRSSLWQTPRQVPD